MKYKEGVIRKGLHPAMRRVEKIVDEIWPMFGVEAVMTSGLDGDHSQWSWHHYGCAADFRTRDLIPPHVHMVAAALRDRLGVPYQVVIEDDHIHVEFDPEAYGMKWTTS